MTGTIDRHAEFIAKLVRLSVEGRIDWVRDERGGYHGRVLGRNVRVAYETKVVRTSNFIGTVSSNQQVPVLELIDDDGAVTYTFRDLTGIGDLIRSAAHRASGIDRFMDEVLAS